VDFAVPGAAPGKDFLIPGIVTLASTVDTPDPSVLRLVATGAKDAVATVRLWGKDGEVDFPGAEDIALPAGEVTDVPLIGLPEGDYTAHVTADRPVIAAALSTRQTAEGTAPREFAWSASGAAPDSGFLPVFAETARLAVGADADTTLSLQAIGANGEIGEARELAVPAGKTASFALADLGLPPDALAVRYGLSGRAGLAAVNQAPDGAGISILTPTDSAPAKRTMTVDGQGL
jgi:hypothetical protein